MDEYGRDEGVVEISVDQTPERGPFTPANLAR